MRNRVQRFKSFFQQNVFFSTCARFVFHPHAPADDRPDEQKPKPPKEDPKPPAPQPQPSPPKDAEGAAGSGQDARAALLEKIKNHSA